MNKPKIMFWDLETSPNVVTAFNLKNEQPIHFQNIQQERYIICGSWKFSNEKEIYSVYVNPNDPANDKKLLLTLSEAINKADAIVAHYGDNFDIKFFNTRLSYYKLAPLPPVKQIDTYKMAKKKFLFNNNSLDYLGEYFKVGRKIKINHDAWLGCMKGDRHSLKDMIRYNKQDVLLLEKVYYCLAGYDKSQINVALYYGSCEHCGSDHLSKRGFLIQSAKRVQRFQCQDCGKWTIGKISRV